MPSPLRQDEIETPPTEEPAREYSRLAAVSAPNEKTPFAKARDAKAPGATRKCLSDFSIFRSVREASRRAAEPPSRFDVSPRAAAAVGYEESAEGESDTRDAEIIVALFRTVVLLAAVFGARLFYNTAMPSADLIWLAAFAGVYNIVVGFAYVVPGPFGLRRPLVVAMDMLLITLWMRLSNQWELFPLYYIVVIVAAMWFRVFGGVLTAIFCNFFFLLLWLRSVIELPQMPVFAPAYMLNIALLVLVACLVGFIAEAQDRERTRRLEGQLLVANYQREIDIASQMQALLVPSQWMHDANGDGANGDKAENANHDDAETAPREYSRPSEEDESGVTKVRVLPAMTERHVELGAAMKPARAFGGGDYFDVIPLAGGRTALCIADVSGKSVRAQARLPLLKYSLRALAPLHHAPETLVRRLNETLAPDLQDELFIGLCYVVLDPRHERLSWCNAGHIAPLLFSSAMRQARRQAEEREETPIETPRASTREEKNAPEKLLPEIVALETDGPALGPFPEFSYTAQSIPWRPGDCLLLYTDGLSDALSYGGSEDGEAQIRHIALALDDETWHQPSATARRFVDLAAMALEDSGLHLSAPRRDDITAVIARFEGEVLLPPTPAPLRETPASENFDAHTLEP